VPALNASAAHVALLSDLILRHMQGWPLELANDAAERLVANRS